MRGLTGWGPKSSSAVLAKFSHLECIPEDWREWKVNAANASALASTLRDERESVMLFRTLATLRTDIHLFNDVEELRWDGLTNGFPDFKNRFDNAITAAKGRSRVRSATVD